MYFPRTKTCQVQSKDLNLGHLTNASTIYPLSVCCLAFILSVVFTTFSSVYFNYILYWRILKGSKGLDESSGHPQASFYMKQMKNRNLSAIPFSFFLQITPLWKFIGIPSRRLCGEQAKDSSWSYDSNPIDCLPIITF